jgi:hypothetical protein
MHGPSLQWLPDGFRFQFQGAPNPSVPVSTLLGMYALCIPGALFALIDPVFVPALLGFLLPLPAALVSTVLTPRSTAIEVDHQRILFRSRFGVRRAIPLRSVRTVEVRIDGLEITLRSGRRVRVTAATSGPQLWWIADRIRELCEEVQAFDADQRPKVRDAIRILHTARSAAHNRR